MTKIAPRKRLREFELTVYDRMGADEFRSALKASLRRHATDLLLHIVLPDNAPVELTGGDSQRLARFSTARAGRVVLLLPHSVELFLLHISLILTRPIPAFWTAKKSVSHSKEHEAVSQVGIEKGIYADTAGSESAGLPRLSSNASPFRTAVVDGLPSLSRRSRKRALNYVWYAVIPSTLEPPMA